jgi:hypothetical protein
MVLLLALVVLKELVSTSEGRWRALRRFLSVAIGLLFLIFCITMVMRVVDVLG